MIICGVVGQDLIGVPIGIPDPPIVILFAAIAYGFAANVCYTGGWVVELSLMNLRSVEALPGFAPRAHKLGLRFSVGLTLVPAILSWALLLWNLNSAARGRPA